MLNMNSHFFRSSNFLLVGGRVVGSRLAGWSVGRWFVVGARLVGGFKETQYPLGGLIKIRCSGFLINN